MKTLKPLFVFLLVFFSLSLVSCKKKGCTDNLAENFSSDAKKDDGSCTYARDKFIGNYTCTRACTYGNDTTIVINVTAGPANDEILVTNISEVGASFKLKVSGSNLTIDNTDQYATYEGTGYVSGNTLSLNYEVCETFYYPCSDPNVCVVSGSK